MNENITWDMDYDVVVAGYGYAGAMSAMYASDAGARTVIFEKMRHYGGNSILSGGACMVADDAEEAMKYLRRTNLNTTDDEVLQAFAQGMTELEDLLNELAAVVGYKAREDWGGGDPYPFPGAQTLHRTLVGRPEGYASFPWTTGVKAGGTLFRVLVEHVERRPIDVHMETPIRDLIISGDGVILGVVAEREGKQFNVRANRSVVLCTGGFEHNRRLLDHYLEIQGVVSMSPLGNTGDGILMAQKAGAALWHMWHLHGGYGFVFPDIPVALRNSYGGFRNPNKQMPWIVVDKLGHRYMNEYQPMPQDTPIRAMEFYDPDLLDYPRIPSHIIFDEEGRKLGPIGNPTFNDEDIQLDWSEDNLKEVEEGRIQRFDTIETIAEHLNIDVGVLQRTVARWNELCRLGEDEDFVRPPGTMVPIETPPFFTIPTWPVISNTQGGPVHNAKQQMLDPYGNPIPRLYKAGEMGSIFGHLYMLAGNNSECIIGGKIAGANAAAEAPWC